MKHVVSADAGTGQVLRTFLPTKFPGPLSQLLLLTGLLSACNPYWEYRADLEVAISSEGTEAAPSASHSGATSGTSKEFVPIIDDQYLKPERTSDIRGTLLAEYTPQHFVLDIDYLRLYARNTLGGYATVELMETIMAPNGYIIPRNIDLAHAKGIIRNVQLDYSLYDGLSMQFLPGVGTSNDGFRAMSKVGIVMEPEYDNQQFWEELPREEGQAPSLHWFEFSKLQPFYVAFLSYLTIGADITETEIQNPSGTTGFWHIVGTNTSGNATAINVPGDRIDLSGFVQPEIVLVWELDALVQRWSGSDDPTGLHHQPGPFLTLNLDRPFPISIQVRESEVGASPTQSDTTPPAEVHAAMIAGPTSWNTLQWINPRDDDFDHVEIVRKAGSTPAGHSDGDVIYDGYEPNHVDVTGQSGTLYYYRIITVDASGNRSDGVVLSQMQH